MFSGIVETTATVVALKKENTNLHITLRCDFADQLKIDQSVAHNGVCLTVVDLPGDGTYTVTAIQETLDRSNLGLLKVGDLVNLERSMMVNGRLDGHIVQGHVDTTAVCTEVRDADGSRYFAFRYDVDPEMAKKGYVTVEKGSVTVNGVSLTVALSVMPLRWLSFLTPTSTPTSVALKKGRWSIWNLILSESILVD